ncbi:MAG TPA: class I SAM-dependent methyltransferase [Nitrososphaerales archaeon]|nr:class I SAM-dependent methyltransferase [Nitrososphaerales archaeon]
MVLTTEAGDVIPDYETFDYSTVWRGRGIEDRAEKEVVSRWATGETGIELGGGFGRITQALERSLGQTFMLDYSLSNLRRASSRLKKTTLIRDSFDRLPFDDSVFDFVALIRVIHHVPDPDSLLGEVVRVARNGGTFVLGIANHPIRKRRSMLVTPGRHRIYPTPLSRYGHAGLERVEILGVGAFDNRIGRRAERLFPLATLDVKTSRLWPAKPMLFVRYRVKKEEGKNDPQVRCVCGGTLLDRRCAKCGRSYGQIIDLVKA